MTDRAEKLREIKLWAYREAAALLQSDMDTLPSLDESEPDAELKRKAMQEIIDSLQRRSKAQ